MPSGVLLCAGLLQSRLCDALGCAAVLLVCAVTLPSCYPPGMLLSGAADACLSFVVMYARLLMPDVSDQIHACLMLLGMIW